MKHNRTLRRGLGILLSLVLCLSLLPATALAAGTARETADFTVDANAALTLLNAAKTGEAKSTWDGETKTLTLKGVDFSTTNGIAVQLPGGSTIVLAEGTTNTIASTADNAFMSYGIYATNGMTIEGSGTLTVTGGAAQTKSYGIDAADVTISGGTVTATGGAVNSSGDEYTESCGIHVSGNATISDTAKVNAMGGDATANYSYSRGIYAERGDVTIKGGAVTATGGEAAVNSYGIYAERGDVTISDGTVIATGGEAGESHGISARGDVTIEGGTVTATGGTADNYSYGIDAADVTIEGGNVTANGGDATNGSYGIYTSYNVTVSGTAKVTATGGTADNSTGIYVYEYYDNDSKKYVGGSLTISGGTLTAIGGEANNSDGIVAYGGLTISGGTLTAIGGEVTDDNGDSSGIHAWGDVTISGGTVTAKGGDATNRSYGIYTSYNVTVSGTAKVTATGGTALDSYGINAFKDLTISGGTVTATGSDATGVDRESCGIYVDDLTISGEETKVTATGGKVTGNFGGSSGIFAFNNITISGGTVTATGGTAEYSWGIDTEYGDVAISGGSVTATGGTADNYSYGIDAADVTIEGGNVTANGGEADESCGIYAYDDVTISGGHVIAQTLAGKSATTRAALNKAPGLDSYTGYYWRTSTEDSFTTGNYSYSDTHTYVEFYNGSTYTVTFKANGDSGETSAVTGVSGIYTLPACKFTAPEGKQFKAWSVNDTEYAVGADITVSADTTVTAIWENIPTTTCTVRFDANGGTGSMDAATDVSGDYTLPECGFTAPSGKQFAGWATSANGEVISGTTITVTENTTLYAVWAIPYGVTVNDVAVTDLNKDDVLGNGLVRYDPDTNTVYKAKGNLATLTVAGNGSTDVVLGGDTIAFLTVTGAKNVTGTDTDIVVEANITCTGDVTFNYEKNGLVNLIVTEAQNVTVISSYPNAPAILGYAKINCSGDVTISSANDIAVSRSLTVTAARDVTVTANTASGSSKPAIGGNADIICSGDVTISNTGGGKAVAGNLTYQNASGKHSYTVKTGDSLDEDDLTVVAEAAGNVTYGPESLNAAAVKITVAHVLTYVEAKAATCTEDGNLEHWACTLSCGKLFLDENGTTETTLEAVTIKAGHTADEWHSDSTQHWQVCTVCGEEFNRADHTFSGNTCTECGYTKPSGGGSSSSGGGSSTPTYTPSVTQPENGTVTVSPKAPKKGDTVTITPKPEAGYTVEQILVTDKDGDPVEVINNGDGTYSFTQPAGKVNVEVTFMEDNSMLNFFVDVPAGAYYYDAVLWAAENGITGGVDDTHFAPNAPCTRAQIVTFLWRAAGSPEPENVGSFADVSADSYYAKAVAWAVENGITTGTGDGMFSPDATCTRAQAMAFIWRSQKSADADGVNPFTDVAADAYYADAVQWAVENGITNGSGDGTTFSPNANCTRAQIVTFLFRCLG